MSTSSPKVLLAALLLVSPLAVSAQPRPGPPPLPPEEAAAAEADYQRYCALCHGPDRAGPANRKTNRVIVVEGYMDVIALAEAGIADAVAPLGTALTEAQLGLIWRMVPVPVLCFDGDPAGRRVRWRRPGSA